MATHRLSAPEVIAALTGKGASSSIGASVGAGAAATAAERVAQRSLFIRVRPAPTTLSERRSVLRVLERHGKTDMFKKLGDNASFIAIASTAAAATALINRSPIQYEFLSETFQTVQPWGNPRVATLVQPIVTGMADGTEKNGDGAAGPSGGGSTEASRRQTDQVQHRSFVVSVFPSQDYHHQTMIRTSALHGPWPKDFSAVTAPSLTGNGNSAYKNTVVYNALKAVVPEGAASEGLCDWRGSASDVHMNAAASRKSGSGHGSGIVSDGDGDGNMAGSGRISMGQQKFAHIRQRRARKMQSDRSMISSLLAKSDTISDGNSNISIISSSSDSSNSDRNAESTESTSSTSSIANNSNISNSDSSNSDTSSTSTSTSNTSSTDNAGNKEEDLPR